MFTVNSLVLSVFILTSLTSYPQTWDELIYQGKKERADGNYNTAADLIFKGADLKDKDHAEHFYYAGVLYTRVENINLSFVALEKAIDEGMYDLARWKRNSRLKILHNDPRWDKLMEKMLSSELKYSDSLSHPKLRQELRDMWKNDQDLVGQWEEQKKAIDHNTNRLKAILEQYGWPSRKMVGRDGSWIAWAIAQHSGDIEFQKRCLSLLNSLLRTNQAEPVLYAELFDRICRDTNKKQKYGMAIIEKEGIKTFYPIELESHVDERRKSIGLSPLREYANENYVQY